MDWDLLALILLSTWVVGSFAALMRMVWQRRFVSRGSLLIAAGVSFFAAAVGMACGVCIVFSQVLSYFAWLLEIIPSAFLRITLIPTLMAMLFAFISFDRAVRQYSHKPSEKNMEQS